MDPNKIDNCELLYLGNISIGERPVDIEGVKIM